MVSIACVQRNINDPTKLAAFLFKGRPGGSSNARVERGPSEGARSASRRTTRLPLFPFKLSRVLILKWVRQTIHATWLPSPVERRLTEPLYRRSMLS